MRDMLTESDIRILVELHQRSIRGENITKRGLAKDLGMSTQALWKHIRRLKRLGCLEYTPAKYTAAGRAQELLEKYKAS